MSGLTISDDSNTITKQSDPSQKKRVTYFYEGNTPHHYYGAGHPMKPYRLKLTHHLILAYGLYRKLTVYKPHIATSEEMVRFHTPEYVDFVRKITPDR